MRNFFVYKKSWYHTNDFTALPKNGVGYRTHHPHTCTTVDKAQILAYKNATKLLCGLDIFWPPTWTRSTKHAHSFHVIA